MTARRRRLVHGLLICLALFSVAALVTAACGVPESPRADEAAAAQTSAYVHFDDVPGIDGMAYSEALRDHIRTQIAAACGGSLCVMVKPVPNRPECTVDKHDTRYPLPARYLRGDTILFPVVCPVVHPSPSPPGSPGSPGSPGPPPCVPGGMNPTTGMATTCPGMDGDGPGPGSTDGGGTHDGTTTNGSTQGSSTGGTATSSGTATQSTTN